MPDAANDPFSVLGLPRSFDIDPRALQAAYFKRSGALHPDRFTDPIQQAEAARKAATINDARAVLADDEQRGNALLSLLGGPSKEQDKSLPEGFLPAIMEVREEMELVLASEDPQERARFEQWATTERQELKDRIAALFERAGTSAGQETLREIRRQLNAWRYIERLIEQLDPDWKGVQ